MSSIRYQLLVWLSIVVLAAAVAAAGISYAALRMEVTDLFDDHMVSLAQSLRNESDLNFVPPGMPAPAPGGEFDDDDFIIEVFDRSGVLVSTSVPLIEIPMAARSGFSQVSWKGEAWRVFVLPMKDRYILVAQNLGARDTVRSGAAFRILWPILGLIPLLGGMIWLIVGRSLRPVSGIAAALDTRTSAQLDPLPQRQLPREIHPLVVAINDLMSRLKRSLVAQRQFIADAAHELRTPLAAIDFQAQLVDAAVSDGERRDAVQRLRTGLRRATRVVEQLLTMARLEPEATPGTQTRVTLDDLAKQGLADFAQFAQQKGIELGSDRVESAEIVGDHDELRILIANLLDNAIRYTVEGGTVSLSVYQEYGRVALDVADSGPGIPERDRDRVFDRFFRRPGNTAAGTGLGLAIVKRIVEQHHGEIELGPGPDSRGLRVSVRFPVADMMPIGLASAVAEHASSLPLP